MNGGDRGRRMADYGRMGRYGWMEGKIEKMGEKGMNYNMAARRE